uniref:Uncharacterized protein n=1 Tax=Glossina pallidipes TaxID=7398 RepID=A0A1A9ZYE6_GLOPL
MKAHYMVRRMPFPAAINRPVGPFILSVHPGTGSRQTGITIDGLKIIAGSSPKFSATKDSDNDFVYAYVLVPRVFINTALRSGSSNLSPQDLLKKNLVNIKLKMLYAVRFCRTYLKSFSTKTLPMNPVPPLMNKQRSLKISAIRSISSSF